VAGATSKNVGALAVVVGAVAVVTAATADASGVLTSAVLNATFVVGGVGDATAARAMAVSELTEVRGITSRAVTRSKAEMSGKRMARLLLRR
jgi:hypothetical protein